ncbi:hypothetical protein EJ110_NYTH38205 [Nymphaea thermarum]|nr:hypothetical protein EJ110_NYTH38205 [Nymphaea thermarum]
MTPELQSLKPPPKSRSPSALSPVADCPRCFCICRRRPASLRDSPVSRVQLSPVDYPDIPVRTAESITTSINVRRPHLIKLYPLLYLFSLYSSKPLVVSSLFERLLELYAAGEVGKGLTTFVVDYMSVFGMAAKPAFTNEAIALTEKKIDMTLDDIVKMSKKPASKGKNTRIVNKNRGLINKGTSQTRASQLKQFSDSRATLRQGVLAQRRSNFKANSQFPFAVEAARKVANEPVRMRVSNWHKTRPTPVAQRKVGQVFSSYPAKVVQQWNIPKGRPQTLDSLFANLKEQRLIKARGMALNGQAGRRRAHVPPNSYLANNRGRPSQNAPHKDDLLPLPPPRKGFTNNLLFFGDAAARERVFGQANTAGEADMAWDQSTENLFGAELHPVASHHQKGAEQTSVEEEERKTSRVIIS